MAVLKIEFKNVRLSAPGLRAAVWSFFCPSRVSGFKHEGRVV